MSRKNWTSEKIFSRLLKNKSKGTYWNNISELRKRPNNDIYEKAYCFAKSQIESERIVGINVLAQLGFDPRFRQKETLDLFFNLIENEKRKMVQISLLYGISHNNESLTKDQIRKLVPFKCSCDSGIRQALVNSLCGSEDELAIEALILLSNDSDSSVRDWATFGLGTQIETNNDKIRDALWSRINDSDQNTKFEAIVGLANRNDCRVKDIIIKELRNEEYGSLLLDAIEIINDKDFLPFLEESLIKIKNGDEVQQSWVLALEETIESLKK